MNTLSPLSAITKHLIKLIGLIVFALIAIGSGTGTPFQTIPGKTIEENMRQSRLSGNQGLILIGRDPELIDVAVYETGGSRSEQNRREENCHTPRWDGYSYVRDSPICLIALANAAPDVNRGKKYYFRNGIAISEEELEQLRQQHRTILRQQRETANRARQEEASRAQQEAERRRLETEVRLQQEAQARIQEAERIRIRNIKPQLNTAD
jgi:hypothetical protein